MMVLRRGADEGSHPLPGALWRLLGWLPVGISGGGVAKMLTPKGEHRLLYGRVDGSGSIIVEVYRFSHAFSCHRSLIVLFHSQERSVPGMIPDGTGIAIDTEHPLNLHVLQGM